MAQRALEVGMGELETAFNQDLFAPLASAKATNKLGPADSATLMNRETLLVSSVLKSRAQSMDICHCDLMTYGLLTPDPVTS